MGFSNRNEGESSCAKKKEVKKTPSLEKRGIKKHLTEVRSENRSAKPTRGRAANRGRG